MRAPTIARNYAEVLFTLFQLHGMSDEKYAEDAGLVARDLETLKKVLER